MSNYVFVIDTKKQPLNPVHPAFARKLLAKKKAAIFRRYPFTIILKQEVVRPFLKPIQLKLDPGAKTTGIALVQDEELIWAANLTHRGNLIRDSLTSRRQLRRARRSRKTRYRKPRFMNRKRPSGWLAPSLKHRVLTTLTWVKKLIKYAPIKEIYQELVKFDTQKIINPEISGVEYQQGTLAGYEVKEYLLEKWGRKCVYCGRENVPWEIEHIIPKSKGGSNRVSNLTIACQACNQKKGSQELKDFLSCQPDLITKILAQTKKPLNDAAAVNTTRWALFKELKQLKLPVITGTGGQTKYNRCRLNLSKYHYIDAACVGNITNLKSLNFKPLLISAKRHGNRQMCGTNKYGFPIRHRGRNKIYFGFQTGDIVKAIVTKGKKIGTYTGRVMCRKSGSFDITTNNKRVAGIGHKYCQAIHKHDGYNYEF